MQWQLLWLYRRSTLLFIWLYGQLIQHLVRMRLRTASVISFVDIIIIMISLILSPMVEIFLPIFLIFLEHSQLMQQQLLMILIALGQLNLLSSLMMQYSLILLSWQAFGIFLIWSLPLSLSMTSIPPIWLQLIPSMIFQRLSKHHGINIVLIRQLRESMMHMIILRLRYKSKQRELMQRKRSSSRNRKKLKRWSAWKISTVRLRMTIVQILVQLRQILLNRIKDTISILASLGMLRILRIWMMQSVRHQRPAVISIQRNSRRLQISTVRLPPNRWPVLER